MKTAVIFLVLLATATISVANGDGFPGEASIGDRVWEDLNANGIQEPGEPGIPGVTVNLYDCSYNLLDSTVTDESGNYNFIVEPGDYFVEFEVPADYYLVHPDQGVDDTIDSDADATTGQTDCTTLEDQEVDDTLDAGMYQLVSIGDQVWEDLDADGIRDENETGIPGVTVELYDCFGNLIALTTTDANGFYQFTGMIPGDHYVVFVLPTGYEFSPPDQGIDDSVDSDADITTGQTDCTNLGSQEVDGSWDAGMYQRASIGDLVWEDLDHDGLQDIGEPGISGVTVEFYECYDNVIAATVTDASGFFLFTDIVPGEYYLKFIPPAGYFLSPQEQGNDDSRDSDADVTSGLTECISLESGEIDLARDAGVTSVQWGSIGDQVWEDLDIDGIQDAGELGIAGVVVELHDCNSNLLAATVTDTNGFYQFTGLIPGNYSLGFVPPDGYVFSPHDQGADDSLDSDADPNTGLTVCIELTPGEYDVTVDAGIFEAIPDIDVEKFTNGLEGGTCVIPGILVGDTVTWKYVVTNTGNVPLDNIVLTDNSEGTILCPQNTLFPGEAMECELEGIAEYGHYVNVANVTAQFDGLVVSDEDEGEYYGYEAGDDDWEPPAVPTADPFITSMVLGIFAVMLLRREKK